MSDKINFSQDLLKKVDLYDETKKIDIDSEKIYIKIQKGSRLPSEEIVTVEITVKEGSVEIKKNGKVDLYQFETTPLEEYNRPNIWDWLLLDEEEEIKFLIQNLFWERGVSFIKINKWFKVRNILRLKTFNGRKVWYERDQIVFL